MKEFEFTLILDCDPDTLITSIDALYDAGCGDGTPGCCNGVCDITFTREGKTLEEAIESATNDVHKTAIRVKGWYVDDRT